MSALEWLTALLVLVTGLLVVITAWYAWSTHRILKQMAGHSRIMKISAVIQARAPYARMNEEDANQLRALTKLLTKELEESEESL